MIKAIDRLPGKKTMTIALPLLFLLLLQIIDKTSFLPTQWKVYGHYFTKCIIQHVQGIQNLGGLWATKAYKGYLSNYKQSSFEFKAISSGK